ncbi:hypothetical protein BKA65DRAFT_239993 [Rhexocercosporidium sp. MPI-PUGE-AT-0058]|nr:hypothetical protein BKA65DRAFT_239993 [Rhexocercosporidium sp. MPI-PUGE-AT-0058]
MSAPQVGSSMMQSRPRSMYCNLSPPYQHRAPTLRRLAPLRSYTSSRLSLFGAGGICGIMSLSRRCERRNVFILTISSPRDFVECISALYDHGLYSQIEKRCVWTGMILLCRAAAAAGGRYLFNTTGGLCAKYLSAPIFSGDCLWRAQSGAPCMCFSSSANLIHQ